MGRMRAVVVDRLMEPGNLRVSELPEPPLVAGGVAVEVRAAGCNFSDVLMVRGQYQVKPDLPFVPGREFAGVVRSVHSDVEGLRPGDRVFGSAATGCFAEIVVVPAGDVHRLPPGGDFARAAALPIAYTTSYAALVFRARLQAGETLLVHAAAGGVGSAAVQIGRALGARVIATAGGKEKLEIAKRAGAHELIDYRSVDFAPRVNELTGGSGADVIYDPVGGDTFDQSLRCIAWGGRLLVVGFAGGRIPTLRANRILLKNIAVVGVHWPAYAEHEPARVAETYDGLGRLLAKGEIEPLIFGRYSLEQVASALEALAGRKTWGKLIVEPAPAI